jgi:serine-type D-Ala-D-Ala carboxypeptidase/endopeptidase
LPDNSQLFKQPDFDKLPFQLIALEKSYDNKKYRQELHELKPDTIPGSVYFRYSNIGVKLLSFILEDVYQQPYEQLLKRNILTPLKMTRTVLSVKDSSSLVRGYSPTGKPMPYTLDNAGAAGGIRSCTHDMARYLQWHMNENNAWIREAHTLLHGDLFYYARGYNWNMEKKGAQKKIWQSGGTFGMSSAIVMYPQEQIGFVLLANDACMDTQGKLSIIAETVLSKIVR